MGGAFRRPDAPMRRAYWQIRGRACAIGFQYPRPVLRRVIPEPHLRTTSGTRPRRV